MGIFSVPIQIGVGPTLPLREFDAIVDTGASITSFPAYVLDNLGIPRLGRYPSRLANGETGEVDVGQAWVRVEGAETSTLVAFAEEQSSILLGIETLEDLFLGVDPRRRRLIRFSDQPRFLLEAGQLEQPTHEQILGGIKMARLSLADAENIIAGCKAKLDELGVNMCVAVVDPRGDLIAMIRQDGAPWRSVMICQGKAVASVAWLRPSGELTDIAQTPVQRGLMAMLDGRMIPGQGALPVYRDGEIVGAVGCSGGAAEEDEAVALAGITSIGLTSAP